MRSRTDFLVTPDKQKRVLTAAGFLSGLLACLNATRDARVVWPPDAAWAVMSSAHRWEVGIGLALMVATLIVSVVRGTRAGG
jgi:hypothetical protein